MRLLRGLARFVGWLLTPLVAWAASFCGAWLGARAAGRTTDGDVALGLTIGGAALLGLGVTLLWLRALRRSPELQQVLAVTSEGIPVAIVEPAETTRPADPPAPAPVSEQP